MNKDEFNTTGYTLMKGLVYVKAFQKYIFTVYPKPANPPKGCGDVAIINDQWCVYIKDCYVDEFNQWFTDERRNDIVLELERTTNNTINEELEKKTNTHNLEEEDGI